MEIRRWDPAHRDQGAEPFHGGVQHLLHLLGLNLALGIHGPVPANLHHLGLARSMHMELHGRGRIPIGQAGLP